MVLIWKINGIFALKFDTYAVCLWNILNCWNAR